MAGRPLRTFACNQSKQRTKSRSGDDHLDLVTSVEIHDNLGTGNPRPNHVPRDQRRQTTDPQNGGRFVGQWFDAADRAARGLAGDCRSPVAIVNVWERDYAYIRFRLTVVQIGRSVRVT
jgi:hypothetical protein